MRFFCEKTCQIFNSIVAQHVTMCYNYPVYDMSAVEVS